MPITQKAFTFHCFDSTVEVLFPSPKFGRELIDWYLKSGQPQYQTWSAQKITTVKVLKPTPVGKFVNVHFKVTRGTANSVSLISLADLPNLNAHDWILLVNILLDHSKEYEPIIEHLKRMLGSYIHEIATMDQEVARVMNRKLTVKPTQKPCDENKMKIGQIDSTHLVVMFTKGDAHRTTKNNSYKKRGEQMNSGLVKNREVNRNSKFEKHQANRKKLNVILLFFADYLQLLLLSCTILTMDVVNAIIKPVVETLMVPVKKHLGYLISCRQYIRHMGIKMSELNDTRHSVEEYMNRNKKNHLEVPTQVEGWLEDVEKINAKVEDIPSDVGTCFNLKMRHKIGRKAFKIIEEIESATRKHSNIIWTNYPIPVGKVDLMKASTSKPSMGHHEDFQSREKTFIEALKALEPNKNSHMVALWGMGGVGKTTMMQRLKKVVKEKKMFNFVVEVVVGEQTDPIAIQEAVSNYLGLELKESTKQARADKLRKWFMDNSDEGKTKFLIILDDVWQLVDLNDIGLSSLPNQGVNFKVLLTTRNRDVCTMMGVEPYLIFNIKVLMEAESQSFFRQFVETSDDVDLELHMIGENIVRKCCGLPIAIKTMACALRSKSKDTWKDALSRLEHHDIGNVAYKVFETSYDNLEDEETKSIFLLCGLFPEDLDIPMEDLVRYGWGLKIFKKVYTIGEARIRLTTCIERLIHTNLLMEVDSVGCIKMHDLVRAFVMDMLSKVNNVHASFVNHGNILELPVDEMRDTCKRLSITCQGISEFPRDLKFPNVSILRLMDGDKYLRFPQDFYEEMEKLEVISYEKMKYPFFPSSPQSSTNLRVLHIHKCSLMMFDFSCIGDMLNLEVLSFASSNIKWLPSTIGKLKKLRLLDFTNCNGLHIDNGVLKSLVKLEELYMGVDCGRDISFTDEICNEIAERLKRLYTLELMFFEKLKMKNMSFEKLQRFKISMGRYLDKAFGKHVYSFENTLQLATTKVELLESRLNELFEKTEVLYLSLGDMYDLLDIEVKPSHPIHSSSFYNLRVLVVSECLELIYLFTLDVAKTLSKLEHIEVYKCENMEELIYTDGSGDEKIRFPKLKFLSLHWLPRLLGLCNNVNIIELPQLMELKLDFIPRFTSIYSENKFETSSLLKKEVVIPILEKLDIQFMVDLKEIWPCEFSTREEVKLREINVRYCKNLVNLFPCNPLPLLHHLEELVVDNCSSIEVLFNIDLDCVSEIYSNLKNIKANELGKLREVWRINGANNSHLLIRGFQAVESINIRECKMFRNVFTPITTNFDLGALMEISITREDWRNNYELEETSQEQVQDE
ncbi:probable disease resistance protein At4g27220 [Lactuca sativa]|nr:probable disease resistance protein At4g27220 [Lactuca sativa]